MSEGKRKVRVHGVITLPLWVEIEVEEGMDAEDIQDAAYLAVTRDPVNRLVEFAGGGVGFANKGWNISTPTEYIDNLSFDAIDPLRPN